MPSAPTTQPTDPSMKAQFQLQRRQKFLDLQQAAYEAAKSADPSCVVLSGAFAVGGTRTDTGFIKWLIEHDMMKSCDVLDLHMYWSCDNMVNTVRYARQWMRQADTVKPIWMTEFGAALREDKTWIGQFSHQDIQNFVPKALATAKALGVERLYWYQGYSDGVAVATLDRSGYSLNVTDGPTPAAWSMSAVVRLLDRARALGDAPMLVSRGQAVGYRFATSAGELIVAWAKSPSGQDNQPARATVTINLHNTEIPMELSERPTLLMV